jgi:basic amino acid/polyamine antiporter, APA family
MTFRPAALGSGLKAQGSRLKASVSSPSRRFPASSGTSDIIACMSETPDKRLIGLTTATAVVAANMIGTGVFTSLGFQLLSLDTGFAILALWLVGGLAALCGALSYGELSGALPRSGGEYYLLSRVYHPVVGFLSGWVSVVVGFSAPIAAAAMAMGQYSSRVLVQTGVVAAGSQPLVVTAIALAGVSLVSIVHLFNVKVVSRFQVGFTTLKVSLILLLIVSGFALAQAQPISFLPSRAAIDSVFTPAFAVSLVYVMYAYSGWNAAIYVASDVKQPGRFLPLSLVFGTLIVILLYAPLNAVFLYSAPVDQLKGQLDVGYIAATHIFGGPGGLMMGLLISIGLVSAISSMVWAGPRVTQVMGEDVRILRVLSRKNANGVPHVSLAFQYVLVVALIVTSSFDAIVNYIGFILSASTFLTVAGVFVLRFTEPGLPRPYRVWGYPITPMIFLAVTGWMMYFVVRQRPMVLLAGAATLAVGLVVYFVNQAVVRSASPRPAPASPEAPRASRERASRQ